MPLYGSLATSQTPVTIMSPGDPPVNLLSAENPTSGKSSIQVSINHNTAREVRGIAIDIIFVSAPGAFNYQIQGADTDVDADYETEGSGTVTASTVQSDGTSRARVELSPWVAQFLRIKINTQNANAVNVTATAKVF